jgi:DNA-binding MarR family transcriptional regulator
MKSSNKSYWLSVKRFVGKAQAESAFGELDDLSFRLLEWILSRPEKDHPLFAMDLVLKSGVASPAAIHKSTATLVDKGFIDSQRDPADTRRRIITPTRQAIRELRRLDKEVEDWAKSLG